MKTTILALRSKGETKRYDASEYSASYAFVRRNIGVDTFRHIISRIVWKYPDARAMGYSIHVVCYDFLLTKA